MFELCQNAIVLPRIELPLFSCFQQLQVEVKRQELIVTFHPIYVYIAKGLHTLEALGVLTHCSVVEGIPLVFVLLEKDLFVAVDQITRVLLKQVLHSNVELLMALDCICVVEDSRY